MMSRTPHSVVTSSGRRPEARIRFVSIRARRRARRRDRRDGIGAIRARRHAAAPRARPKGAMFFLARRRPPPSTCAWLPKNVRPSLTLSVLKITSFMGIEMYLSRNGPSMFERIWYQCTLDTNSGLGLNLYELVSNTGNQHFRDQNALTYYFAKRALVTAFGFDANEADDFTPFWIHDRFQTAFGCRHNTNDEVIVFKIYYPDKSQEYRFNVEPRPQAHKKYKGKYIISQFLYTGPRIPQGPLIERIHTDYIPWF